MLEKLRVYVKENWMMLVGIAIIVSAISFVIANTNESTTMAYMNAYLNNITILA